MKRRERGCSLHGLGGRTFLSDEARCGSDIVIVTFSRFVLEFDSVFLFRLGIRIQRLELRTALFLLA